jgi:hypothetical protein
VITDYQQSQAKNQILELINVVKLKARPAGVGRYRTIDVNFIITKIVGRMKIYRCAAFRGMLILDKK